MINLDFDINCAQVPGFGMVIKQIYIFTYTGYNLNRLSRQLLEDDDEYNLVTKCYTAINDGSVVYDNIPIDECTDILWDKFSMYGLLQI